MLLRIVVPQNEEAKDILKKFMDALGIEQNHIHKGTNCYKAVLPKVPTPEQKNIVKKVMEKAITNILPDDENAVKKFLELNSNGFTYWNTKAKELFYENVLNNAILKALNELYAQKLEYA